MYTLEATFSTQHPWKLVTMFVFMIAQMSLEMGHAGPKTRSVGQIIFEPVLITKMLWFKSLHFNAIPHNQKAQVSNLRAILALLFESIDDWIHFSYA